MIWVEGVGVLRRIGDWSGIVSRTRRCRRLLESVISVRSLILMMCRIMSAVHFHTPMSHSRIPMLTDFMCIVSHSKLIGSSIVLCIMGNHIEGWC